MQKIVENIKNLIFFFLKKLEIGEKTTKQIFKFVFVGIFNTFFGYFTFILALYFLNYFFSSIISSLMSITFSYIMNKNWTFNDKKDHRLTKIIKFYFVYFFAWIVNITLLYFFVEFFAINPKISWVLTIPFVTLVTFFGQKFFVFKN